MGRPAGPRPIPHPVAGGFCQTCGELESWLVERGAVTMPAA